jgi:hypothetical protein
MDKKNIADLNIKELSTFYKKSIGISVIGCFWGLVALAQVISIVIVYNNRDVGGMIATPLFFVLWCAAAYGALTRKQFGRILNIILSCILLLGIPIGTVIGIVGLWSFLKTEALFGSSKISHAELAAEKVKRKS